MWQDGPPEAVDPLVSDMPLVFTIERRGGIDAASQVN